jgi:site-specific DNA-adenine methylase
MQTQKDLFGFEMNGCLPKPVNVASVPHRSPFRYPGGKTWFIPRLREWLKSKPTKPNLLIEPFAGGGIVSLTTACENLAQTTLMVEIDSEIDHDLLFQKCSHLAGDFIMTYDNSGDVKELAQKYSLQYKPISMKSTHHANMTELVIGKTSRGCWANISTNQ